MDYKAKYYKYKQKYLQLKELKQFKQIQNPLIILEKDKRVLSGNNLHGGNNEGVKHIWYKDWPDQGVPDINNFWIFINYCYSDIRTRKGGSVIHCSGGIGRTGTVYVILKLMNMFDNDRQLKKKYNIDDNPRYDINKLLLTELIKNTLQEARRHRPQMVERVEQYFSIYQIIIKYLNPNIQLQNIKKENIDEIIYGNEIYKKLQQDFCRMPEYSIPSFYGSNQDIIGTRNNCQSVPFRYPAEGRDEVLSCVEEYCLNKNREIPKNRYDSNPATRDYGISLGEMNTYLKEDDNTDRIKNYINADLMMSLYFNKNVEQDEDINNEQNVNNVEEGQEDGGQEDGGQEDGGQEDGDQEDNEDDEDDENNENINLIECKIIATQAPINNETVNDFKNMVKKFNVKRIIMLTLLEEMVCKEQNDHNIKNKDDDDDEQNDKKDYVTFDADHRCKCTHKIRSNDYFASNNDTKINDTKIYKLNKRVNLNTDSYFKATYHDLSGETCTKSTFFKADENDNDGNPYIETLAPTEKTPYPTIFKVGFIKDKWFNTN